MELRKRLQDVGISTILCWGDKESEGFWHKQGFVTIVEVDAKGRARHRLPIRADIRRALCFPGGSTLMVTHLNENLNETGAHSMKLCLNSARKPNSSTSEFYSLAGTGEALYPASANGNGQKKPAARAKCGSLESTSTQRNQQLVTHEKMDADAVGQSASIEVVAKQISSTCERNTKRRVWETSSSLNSKRVKVAHVSDQSYSDSVFVLNNEDKDDSPSKGAVLGLEENMLAMKS